MGCLIEILFDVLLEGCMAVTAHCYLKLFQLIFPRLAVSERTRDVIKCVTGIIGLCLELALIIGIIMVFQSGSVTKTVGKYTVLISVVLLLLPIASGILAWIIRRCRKSS
jgi:hypothetical protein